MKYSHQYGCLDDSRNELQQILKSGAVGEEIETRQKPIKITYGSAWSQGFLEIARTKGKNHGKGTALSFFVWLDKRLEKIRWQLANPDGKYLIKLRDSDCRYDDIEGIEDAIFGFSTPILAISNSSLDFAFKALLE